MGGNDAALLRTLHDQHAPALWRYVVYLTGDRSAADDIVQETLLKAWRKPSVLDQSESSARAWLFTVAHNLVVDHYRSSRSRHEVTTPEFPERAGPDATEALLDAWLVSDALTTLSAEHRAVVVHAYYGGRSIAEIAAEFDIPEGTVKSRLHYALRALRLTLQEKGVTR